jgi:hypothetical protein
MKASPQLIKWAIAYGFATGHADTEQELLDELGVQIDELRAKLEQVNRDRDFHAKMLAAQHKLLMEAGIECGSAAYLKAMGGEEGQK